MEHSGEVYINPLTDSKEELREYETSVNAYRDIENAVNTAKKVGEKIGMKKGFEKGKAEGIAEGKAQGARDNGLAIARKLKAKGMPTDEIANITGLSVEEIADL